MKRDVRTTSPRASNESEAGNVGLVHLVYLVCLAEPDKPDNQIDKTNEPLRIARALEINRPHLRPVSPP